MIYVASLEDHCPMKSGSASTKKLTARAVENALYWYERWTDDTGDMELDQEDELLAM